MNLEPGTGMERLGMAESCQGIMDESSFEAYQKPFSLWRFIEEHVPSVEHPIIKSILGEFMVDQTLTLRKEIDILLNWWREMRGKFLAHSEAQKQAFCPVLPDSPNVKEMLKQEIHLLLMEVCKKAYEQGRDENKALEIYNQDVVNFAMERKQFRKPGSRPRSAVSVQDGQEVPVRPLTGSSMGDDKPASSLSSSSSLRYNIEAIKDKVNAIDIDEVLPQLKSTLQEEYRLLEQDHTFLLKCLEEEHRYNFLMESRLREPTVAVLKEERRKIERDLYSSTPVPSSLISSKVDVSEPIDPISRRAEFSQRLKSDTSESRGVIRELVHISSHNSLPFSDVKCSSSLSRTRPKVFTSFSGSLEDLDVQSSDVLKKQGDCSAENLINHINDPVSEATKFTDISQAHGMFENMSLEKVASRGMRLSSAKKRIPYVDHLSEKSRTQDLQHSGTASLFPLSCKTGLTLHRTLQDTDVVLAPTPPSVQRSALKPTSSIRRGRLIQHDKIAS